MSGIPAITCSAAQDCPKKTGLVKELTLRVESGLHGAVTQFLDYGALIRVRLLAQKVFTAYRGRLSYKDNKVSDSGVMRIEWL